MKRRRLAKPLAIATSSTGKRGVGEQALGQQQALRLRVLDGRDAELLLEDAAQVAVRDAERRRRGPRGSRPPAGRPRCSSAAALGEPPVGVDASRSPARARAGSAGTAGSPRSSAAAALGKKRQLRCERRPRRAHRPAVDAGRAHAHEEAAVEAGVVGAQGAVALVGVEEHGGHYPPGPERGARRFRTSIPHDRIRGPGRPGPPVECRARVESRLMRAIRAPAPRGRIRVMFGDLGPEPDGGAFVRLAVAAACLLPLAAPAQKLFKRVDAKGRLAYQRSRLRAPTRRRRRSTPPTPARRTGTDAADEKAKRMTRAAEAEAAYQDKLARRARAEQEETRKLEEDAYRKRLLADAGERAGADQRQEAASLRPRRSRARSRRGS